MALSHEGPRTQRVGGPGSNRVPAFVTLFAALFVLVALVKPWTFGGRPPSGPFVRPTGAGGGSPTPPPTADAAPVPRLYPQCFATAGWRVATLQSDVMEVRTVWPVQLTNAASAADALASERVVYGGNVRGIGFCTPGTDLATRVGYTRRVSLWVPDAGGGLTRLSDLATLDRGLAEQGEVYLAPPAGFGTGGLWPPGEYVFRIDYGGGAATWFALRIDGVTPSSVPPPTAPPPTAPPDHPRPGSGAGIASYGRPLAR